LFDLPLWPWGLIAFIILLGAGSVLGQFAGRRLFRSPPGGPPDEKGV
jgi:hypothetical protein